MELLEFDRLILNVVFIKYLDKSIDSRLNEQKTEIQLLIRIHFLL